MGVNEGCATINRRIHPRSVDDLPLSLLMRVVHRVATSLGFQ
jgi:hypothetical protein